MLVRLLPAMNETGESQSEARMVTFDQSEAWKLSKKTDVDDADRGDA